MDPRSISRIHGVPSSGLPYLRLHFVPRSPWFWCLLKERGVETVRANSWTQCGGQEGMRMASGDSSPFKRPFPAMSEGQRTDGKETGQEEGTK